MRLLETHTRGVSAVPVPTSAQQASSSSASVATPTHRRQALQRHDVTTGRHARVHFDAVAPRSLLAEPRRRVCQRQKHGPALGLSKPHNGQRHDVRLTPWRAQSQARARGGAYLQLVEREALTVHGVGHVMDLPLVLPGTKTRGPASQGHRRSDASPPPTRTSGRPPSAATRSQAWR